MNAGLSLWKALWSPYVNLMHHGASHFMQLGNTYRAHLAVQKTVLALRFRKLFLASPYNVYTKLNEN